MIKIAEKGMFNSIDQFQILHDRSIGTGSFGVVKLAIHSRTYRVYALKIISLNNITNEAELKLLERQIKLHSQIDHPHIVKLWDTIIDQENIYMVLEYAENGNLFYYQNKKITFSETQAFKFFMQTVEAIRYLHQNDILHRDLKKPQNLLLDADFNIKLCDFGWCTEKIYHKKNTFCGTYQYMSPQMIFGRQYDHRIDVWALGILLYEMLHGSAPFKGQSAKQVKKKMIGGEYNISNQISDEAKDLLMGILKFIPEDRLTIAEIMEHQWVQKLSKIMDEQLRADEKKFNIKAFHNNISSMKKQKNPIVYEKTPQKQQVKTASTLIPSFHKKTSSMDIEQKKNLNINLSINNYAVYQKKKLKPEQRKNEAYSESKRKESQVRCQTQQNQTKVHLDQFSLASPRAFKKSKDKKKFQSMKKIDAKKILHKKYPVMKLSPSILHKHRKSQEELMPKNYFRFRTDMQASSRNIAKTGNNLKKSRNKDFAVGKVKNSNHIRSQHCLGVTQKLKKK